MTLSSMVIDSNKKEVRDIYSLAIRNTIQELNDNSAMNTIKVVYPNLIKGLREMKDEVKEECLDIFADFFKKFG